MIDLEQYERTYMLEHATDPERARNELQYLKHFIEFCGRFRPSLEILKEWRRSLTRMKPASRNRYMKSVRSWLRMLHYEGDSDLTDEDVAVVLKPFRVPQMLPTVWYADDLQKLLKAVGTHANRPFRHHMGIGVLLIIGCGLRPGEAINLRRRDVDLKRSWLSVYSGKTMRERRVPVDSPVMLDLFSRLWNRRDPDEKWFQPAMKYRQFPHTSWKEILKIAGLRYEPPKILRATHVAHVASSHRFSTYELTARFGHSEKVSHQFYYQPIPGIQGDNVDQWLGCEEELQKLLHNIILAEFKDA